jgi:hypothetical protein
MSLMAIGRRARRCQLARATAMALAVSLGSAAFSQAQNLAAYPDWSGQWRTRMDAGVNFAAQWDPTKPIGRGQEAPLTPEYQARYEANLADQAAGGQGDERHGFCVPLGMPRMMSAVYPMEIVVTQKTTYILTDNSEPRRIFTDGRDWPGELDLTFSGLSLGKWVDPDPAGSFATLEVETRGFKGPRTFETSGIRLHDDNQTVVKERIHLDKADSNILLDEITTFDHALTRPWTVVKKYNRVSDTYPVWHYNECAESNPLIRVGNDSYYISWDGFLMPVKKGQAPPDLRYFK